MEKKYNDYRYGLSLTSQFYFCGIPFRLDTTPKCSLNCLYCYAMVRGGRRTSAQLITNPSIIEKKIRRVIIKEYADLDVNGQLLKRRVPIHFGGMSDPFSNNYSSKISREILQILSNYDFPTIISTKNSSELIKDDTLSIIQRMKKLVIQISLSSCNPKINSIVEPNAPSAKERLKSLKILSNLGVPTIVRLQPLFPSLLKEVESDVIPKIAHAGVNHIIIEFIKLPVESNISKIKDLYKQTGWKDFEFFQDKNAVLRGREWLLPIEYKWDALQPIINTIRKNGMTYGAGDYGLHHLGDTACCCGIDKYPGFSNWFQGNFSNIIRNAREGPIFIGDLKKYWYPNKSIRQILNSNSRKENKNSISAYLKDKWNRPGTVNAPNEYLGISWKGEVDENQNIVYTKNNV